MAGNSKNRIDLGYNIIVDVKGLNKLSADLGKLKGGEKALLHLTSLIGGLDAIAAEIKYLAGSGLDADARRLAEQTKRVYDSISTLQVPDIKKPRRKGVRRTKDMTKKEYSEKVDAAEAQYQLEVEATAKAVAAGVNTITQTLRVAKQNISSINTDIKAARKSVPKPDKEERGGFTAVREESGERPSQEEFDSYAQSDWRASFQKQREREYAEQNAAWERQLKRESELARRSVMPEVWSEENRKLEAENQRRTRIIKERAAALEESIWHGGAETAKDMLAEKSRALAIAKAEAELAKEKIRDARDYKDLEEKIAVAKQKAREYSDAQAEVDVLKEVISLQKERNRLFDERKAKELKDISDSARLGRSTKGASQYVINTTADLYGDAQTMKDRKAILEQEIEANSILIKQAKERAMLASEDDFEDEKQRYGILIKETQAKQLELNILRQSIPVRQQKDNLLKKEAENLNKIKQAENAIRSLMASMDKGNTQDILLRIRQINAELTKIPKDMREASAEKFAKELNDAGINVARVGTRLERVKGGIDSASAGAKSFGAALRDAVKKMFSVEKLVQRISFVITAVSSYRIFDTVKDTLRSVVGLNIEFQDEMSKTYAIMDDKSEAAKQKLSEQVRALAKEYRISMKEAAEGIYEVISAQVSLKDSAVVLEAAMKLAVGGFSSLKDATLALVQLLNAYDMDMSRAAHVADVAFETTRLGIITTQQYADQMSKLGSTASIFGISIEEVSAAISVMTRNGVRADQAFTSLNQLLLTIANPTEEAKRTMDAYGVSLDMNAVRAKGLVNALLDLGPVLESEEAMTNIVKSRTGAKAMFSLVQNSEDYIDDLIAMYDSTGSAAAATNERLQSTASLIQQLSVTLREIAIGIGESLDPVVRGVLGFLNNALQVVVKNAWMFRAVLKGIMLQLAVTQGPKLFMFMAAGIIKATLSLRALVSGFQNLGKAIKSSFSGIKNFIASLPKVFTAMKGKLDGVKLGAIGAGKAMATAWAEATAGLSVIITLVTQLVGWLGEAAQRSREAKIDKALGTKGIEAQIGKVNTQIDILDSKIASIEGIRKMTKQADELYKSIGNNVKQTENFNKVHNKTVEALNKVLNTQIDASKVRGKLAQFDEQLQLKYISLEEEKIRLIIKRQKLEQLSSSAELLKEMSKARPGSIFTRRSLGGKTEMGFADEWWRSMQAQMTSLGRSMRDITEKSTQATIQNARKQIIALERQVESGGRRYAGDKVAGSKTNELLMQLTGWELFLQQVEDGQLSLATGFKMPDFPQISQSVKELGKAAGDMHNKINDVINKYTDLFRSFGVSYDSASVEKLRDVQDAVVKMRQSANNILPDQSVIDALDNFGAFAVQFGEIGELLKKKTRKFEDVAANLAEMRGKLARVSGEDISKYVDALLGTGIPELEELARHLPESIMSLIETQTEQVDDYVNNQIVSLMRKAGSEEAKIELSTRALMLNESLYESVVGASLDELEKILNNEKTPESAKTAIRHNIDKKRRNIANALRTMAGSYGGLLTDLEKNIGDVEGTFKYMRDRITEVGGSTDIIEDMIRAFATGNIEAQGRFFEGARAGKYKFLTEPGAEAADTKFPGKTIPTVEEYLQAVEQGLGDAYLKHFAQIYDGKIAYLIQNFIAEMKAFIPEKISQLNSSIKEKIDWTRTMSRQPGTDWESNFEALEYKDLFRRRDSLNNEETIRYEAIKTKWESISAEIHANERAIAFYNGLSAQLDAMISANNISEDFNSFKKNLEESIKEMLEKSGYFKLTPQEQRKYFYRAYGQKPGDIAFSDVFRKGELTEKPIVSVGQIQDAVMRELKLDEGMTIAGAFNIAQSKIIEVSSQAWSQYWEGRIQMAEDARDRLLKIEDDYMDKVKSQNDMMLANENISADQKEALARRLEEQQRKSEERKQEIQKQYDKKAADIKKKQVKWELGISFAKAVAEIWARELSSKGALGLASAATLTGFLTSMFAVQMALLEKQSFAGGGYTGAGVGAPDSTGHKPAGIVHAGEIVFPKSVVDKNFPELMGMYAALKSGSDFNSFIMSHLLRGSRPVSVVRNNSGLYASGGFVSRASYARSMEPVLIDINLSGARVIDDVELHKRVELGGKKRRYIDG